ncbi:hypothetical protein ACIPWY_31655 [Streptomyces sp. NPDC090032]|uniref:hypothetical protein n=1 Tax=unclassified Streptomyces TaxID=2593676 RepID=UPI003711BC16
MTLVICDSVGNFDTRTPNSGPPPDGLAEVFSLHTHRSGRSGQQDERSYFFDTLAEYQWARDAVGLMPSTIDQLAKPVLEVCEHYDLVPWQLTPTLLDRYFAGPGMRRDPHQHAMNVRQQYASADFATRPRPCLMGR